MGKIHCKKDQEMIIPYSKPTRNFASKQQIPAWDLGVSQGAFFWNDLDQDQWAKVTGIMVYQKTFESTLSKN